MDCALVEDIVNVVQPRPKLVQQANIIPEKVQNLLLIA